MLRIKDPKASLAFYQDVLGMKLFREDHNPDAKFSLYFLVFDNKDWAERVEAVKDDEEERRSLVWSREGAWTCTLCRF